MVVESSMYLIFVCLSGVMMVLEMFLEMVFMSKCFIILLVFLFVLCLFVNVNDMLSTSTVDFDYTFNVFVAFMVFESIKKL